MKDINTIIIVKNIPLQKVEQLVKQVITPNFFENDLQEIVFNLKNSRLLFLSFPNTISNSSFKLIANVLFEYNENKVSAPEIYAIYNNEVYINKTSFTGVDMSVNSVVSFYKIDKTPLHQILSLNKNNCKLKKWWHFF